jgi:hypothetical protein
MKFDAFVSYASPDWPRVRRLCVGLEARGKRLWIDTEQFEPTDDWENEVKSGIADARVVLLLVTPKWLKSAQCGREVELARDAMPKPVLTVILSDTVAASSLSRVLLDVASEIVDGTGPPLPTITRIDARLESRGGT